MGLPRSFHPSPRRLLLAALVVPALAVPLVLAASGCPYDYTACLIPSDGKLASDGGADPCRCSEPPTPGDRLCECQSTEQGKVLFQLCVQNLCAPDGINPQNPLCLAIHDAGNDRDAADDGPHPGCTGECLPSAPLGWSEPVLLWFGVESGVPACPDVALGVGFEGHAGLSAPPAVCGACSCGPPHGSCGPPAAVTVSDAPCSEAGSPVPLDPPVAWDDPCASIEAPDGGSIGSVTFGPLVVHESGCSPQQPAPEIAPLAWDTFARACTSTAGGACASTGERCAPAGASGFQHCVFHEGELTCETYSSYVERHVFYKGAVDTRGCSECSCQPPAGGACSGSISIYEDGSCGVALAPSAGDVSSSKPLCFDVPAGSTVGSALLDPEIYDPGICQPDGGAVTGSAEPASPVTFCCMPAR